MYFFFSFVLMFPSRFSFFPSFCHTHAQACACICKKLTIVPLLFLHFLYYALVNFKWAFNFLTIFKCSSMYFYDMQFVLCWTQVNEKTGGYINRLVVTCVRSGLNRKFRVLQKPERAPIRALRTSSSGRLVFNLESRLTCLFIAPAVTCISLSMEK